MKLIRHIINGIIWVVVGLYVLIILLIHIPPIQSSLGGLTASAISEKLGTRVHVGRIDLGFLNRIIIDDVLIYDRQNKEMIKAARISVRIDFLPLLENKISISSAQIFGTHIQLYQQSKDSPANFRFVLDALASNDNNNEKTTPDIRVNTFIMQHSSVSFDRYDVPPTNTKLNPCHLKITDISVHLSLKAFNEDSLNVIVKKLAFKEQSGLRISKLEFKAEANRNRCVLHDFRLRMPATDIMLKNITATYRLDESGLANGSLRYSGGISPSKISLSDFSFLLPPLGKFTDPLTLSADFSGTDNGIMVPRFVVRSTGNELDIKINAWLNDLHSMPRWTVNASGIEISPEYLCLAYSCLKEPSSNPPLFFNRLGHLRMKGKVASDGNVTHAECAISSQSSGIVDINLFNSKSGDFKGNIQTTGIDIGHLLDNEKLGHVAMNMNLSGKMPSKGTGLSLSADGTIPILEYMGYRYDDIAIGGKFGQGNISGSLRINDPNIMLDIEGNIKKTAKAADVKVKASLRDFSPAETRLTGKWGKARFNADVNADFSASNLNDAKGFFAINNFLMATQDEDYSLEQLLVTSGFNDDGTHYIKLDSDFGEAEVSGRFDYTALANSVAGIIKKRLPTVPGLAAPKSTEHNDFSIIARIGDTTWLERILGIPLRVESEMLMNGYLDDKDCDLSVSCDIPKFLYNDKEYRAGKMEITSDRDTIYGKIGVTKIMDNGHHLDLKLACNAADNKLSTSFSWDNNAKRRQSGTLNTKTRFFLDENSKTVTEVEVQPSHINVNNATWNIEPSVITYMKNNISVDKFAVTNGGQHIIIDGIASVSANDSLSVDLHDIDIEYILELVNFHSVDFSGRASGKAWISAPFGNLAADGNLTVSNFKFENGRMGVLNANVEWDNTDKQINIDAIADDGPDAMTFINGYVSPAHNSIELGIKAAGTHIDFMQSFTSSFMRDISGKANGKVVLGGPLNAINLTGELVVDGEATVKATNCKYFLRGDTVRFVPDEIELCDMPVYDIYNHRGVLSGFIHHKHLTRLSYDLSLSAYNLLAYNFRDFGDDSFYGTVYGTGNVDISGRSGEVDIDINITPQKNSSFVYNASTPDAISNQEFIQWDDVTSAATDDEHHAARVSAMENIPTDIRIKFNIDCTPDATLKILMDGRTNDYITLNGSGNIRATYYNKGSFNMFGTYVVEHGTYGITIQDIIKKNFTFDSGGTITFGGDPYEANLDLMAIHTVNGVSLSDLNIGKSFSNNTTRVNCLMNIGGQPRAPKVDFDIDMPTMSSDEKQMIRSIINSEDEMNQQVVYLLGIGRFYPQEANNSSAQGESQLSQTSLAMQSLLSGTISSQINSVLNTVINNNNWNFGANISTGDEGWNNAEYEGLLSGRLLNNRLLINGQFGYRDNQNNASTSFIGDFDVRYLLFPNGDLAVNIYNKTNDRYFTKSSLNTQGVGLIIKKDFNGLKDLFATKRKKKKQK